MKRGTRRNQRQALAYLASTPALLTLAASVQAAAPKRLEIRLTCSRMLALRLAGCERYYAQRRGDLTRPDQDYLWSTYAHCRRHPNSELARQLAPSRQQQLGALQRSLTALEASYARCAFTRAYSASIGSFLANWSLPRREELYGEIATDLQRTGSPENALDPALHKVLARGEHAAGTWEQIAAHAKQGDPYETARSRDLHKELPSLRRELREVRDAARSLPPISQTRVARHLARYLKTADG